MQDFQFLVTDDRYAVPSVKLIQANDVAEARQLAGQMLEEPHHRVVEGWQGDTRLFTLTRATQPPT